MLTEVRNANIEEFNSLKVKLETNIQTLEQHLETMRATYQLNAEKLDYNYRVLLERDSENSATINQQKRKVAAKMHRQSNFGSILDVEAKRYFVQTESKALQLGEEV